MGFKLNLKDRNEEVKPRKFPTPTHECRPCRLKTTLKSDPWVGTIRDCGICGKELTTIRS